MTALTGGRHRAGRGNATRTTARVRVAFVALRERTGRSPTVPEVRAELAAGRIEMREEAVALHLRLARLRPGEGA